MLVLRFPLLNSKMAASQEEFEASVRLWVRQSLLDTSFEVLDEDDEVVDLLHTGHEIKISWE